MIVYSSENCPQCTFLKKWLDDRDYDYDVVTDEEVLTEKGIVSIPQLELDDGTLLTFREALSYKWGD